MSLLRRRRRQNRIAQQAIPATRETRISLEPFELSPVRGLRINKEIDRSLRVLRRAEQKRLRKLRWTINPLNRANLKTNRVVKNVAKFNQSQEHSKATIDWKTGDITVDLPANHKICRQRQERREVLFAKGGTGSGQKPRRKDNNIKIRCEK